MHHREHECFYVLEGEFFFACGPKSFIAKAGAAVFLPKDIPHAFKNVGPTPGRFILLASPAGFEAMVAQAGQAIERIPFDKAVAPEDIQKLLAICPKYDLEVKPDWKPAEPSAPPAHDRKLWVLGHLVTIKLTAADTNGVLSLAEVASAWGQSVPAHSHHELDELFYVLEGTWEFVIDGKPTVAPVGTTVFVAPGSVHGFKNIGAGRGRLLDCHLPGGFEAFFEDVGAAATGDGPPAPAPDRDTVVALFKKHGMDLLG